jgi:nicotinamidase/pyrazinamidase
MAVVDYDPTTALLVVDLQNDFADPAGSLYVRGGGGIVPLVNAEIDRAVDAGATVIYTQDWHPESTPHFARDGGIWPVHCVQETWGAALHPGLRVVEGAPILRKGADGRDGYSAFSVRDPRSGEVEATQLETILHERGLDLVVVAGLATDYCVVETVADALRLGHPTAAILNATRAVDRLPGDGERAIERMREAGARLL